MSSVYFPHTGKKDEEVEAMYAATDADSVASRSRGAVILVGGDFNAEVGAKQQGEDESIIGKHAEGPRNRRGEMMAKWAWDRKLVIAKCLFEKPWAKKWTHRRKERERVIDYFCVGKKMRGAVLNVEVWPEINLGSDHRAVKMSMRIGGTEESKKEEA